MLQKRNSKNLLHVLTSNRNSSSNFLIAPAGKPIVYGAARKNKVYSASVKFDARAK